MSFLPQNLHDEALIFSVLVQYEEVGPLGDDWHPHKWDLLVFSAQSCLTLLDLMDCSMPGFPVLYYFPVCSLSW